MIEKVKLFLLKMQHKEIINSVCKQEEVHYLNYLTLVGIHCNLIVYILLCLTILLYTRRNNSMNVSSFFFIAIPRNLVLNRG